MDYSLAKEIYATPWHMDAFSMQRLGAMLSYMKNGGQVAENSTKQNTFSIENQGQESPGKISIIKLDGPITKHGGQSHNGTVQLASQLSKSDADQDVVGHIIWVESGGGSANAVQVMRDAIAATTKPIVSYIEDMAGSAAYYIAAATDHIIAQRDTDMVGSIGTLIEFGAYPKEAENKEDGFRVVRIYADKATNKNAAFEAAINDLNFKPIKEKILNPANERFINDIRADRPNVRDIELTGEIFEAKEVVGTLIDEIGNFESAVNKILELSNAGGQINNNNVNQSIMNLQELKQNHPDLVEAIALEERDRVSAYLQFSDIDLESCKQGIESGAQPTQNFFAEMTRKGIAKVQLEGIQADAPGAIETAKSPTTPTPENVETQEAENFEKEVFAAAGISESEVQA